MKTSHPYSVIHLHQEGAVAIVKKSGQDNSFESSVFYQSPKAVGTIDAALENFLEDAPREKVYINIVPSFPSLQSYKDKSLLEDVPALSNKTETATGLKIEECSIALLDSVSGFEYEGKNSLLVAGFSKKDYETAANLASTLGFAEFKVFNNTLSTLGAINEWRKAEPNEEAVAILELGMESSVITLTDAQGNIASSKVELTLKDMAKTIQAELELKFDSAALMLFFNGKFNFKRIAPKIAESIAVILKPAIESLSSDSGIATNRLMVCSLPPSFTWLGETIPEATGLKGFTPTDFTSFEDLAKMGDLANNPGFIGSAFLAHTNEAETSWLTEFNTKDLNEQCTLAITRAVIAGEDISLPTNTTPTPVIEAVKETPVVEDVVVEKKVSTPVVKETIKTPKPKVVEKTPVVEKAAPVVIEEVVAEKIEAPIPTPISPEELVDPITDVQIETPIIEAPKKVVPIPVEAPVAQKEEVAATTIEAPSEAKNIMPMIIGGLVAATVVGVASMFLFGGNEEPKAVISSANETVVVTEVAASDTPKEEIQVESVVDTPVQSVKAETALITTKKITVAPAPDPVEVVVEVAETPIEEIQIKEEPAIIEAVAEETVIAESTTKHVAEETTEIADSTGKAPVIEVSLPEVKEPQIEIATTEPETAPAEINPEDSVSDEAPIEIALIEEPVVEEVIPAIGSVLIATMPQGATILRDGEYVGKTPFTVSDLEYGDYTFDISKDGYIGDYVDVEITSNELTEAPFVNLLMNTGDVEITSIPAGAKFQLKATGGQEQDIVTGVTPYVVNNVLPGEYEISFEREGWELFKEETTVKVQDLALVEFIYPEGSIIINSNPAGATVHSAGSYIGTTPFRLDSIREGTFTIEANLDQHETLNKDIEVVANKQNSVFIEMKSWNRIVSMKDVDVRPVPTKRGLSKIQRSTRGQNHRFIVELVIDTKGKPEDIHFIESTNIAAHDVIIKDLQRWKFKPAQRQGKAVKTMIRIPILIGNQDELPEVIVVAQLDSEEEE